MYNNFYSENIQNIARMAQDPTESIIQGRRILPGSRTHFQDSEGIGESEMVWRDSEAVAFTKNQRMKNTYFHCQHDFSFGRLGSRHKSNCNQYRLNLLSNISVPGNQEYLCQS